SSGFHSDLKTLTLKPRSQSFELSRLHFPTLFTSVLRNLECVASDNR
ncbi:unnamed protein product, partial [Callosobruchus maculatus]